MKNEMIKRKRRKMKVASLLLAVVMLVTCIIPANLFAKASTEKDSNDSANISLQSFSLDAKAKTPGLANPLITQKFGADPYALVFNGRVYIYMTNDIYEYDAAGALKENGYGKINKISVISSDDMVNWTDHGEIAVGGANGAAKWASNSWAPAAAHKVIDGKDKFFLYFADSARGIGVLTADSPIGPWTDPIGKALITRSVPGAEKVTWLFDPAVLVDDDGSAYLYFGGGIPNDKDQASILHPQTARVIKLGDNMISVEGKAEMIDAPALFEDSGIHKYNGKYYYSYCSNFAGEHPADYPPKGEIAYMVSDSPMGPFTYIGPIFKNPGSFFGVFSNNHHAIFEFKGQWYITYHAQTLGKALGVTKGYRSTHINKVDIASDGKINNIKGDMVGVPQIANLNPLQRVEAETIGWMAGISTKTCSEPGSMVDSINLTVTDIHDGDWVAVSDADFGANGITTFAANVAATVGGQIEIRLDKKDGDVIGTLDVKSTGSEDTYSLISTSIKEVTGVHDVYFMFKGSSSDNLFNFDYWKFGNSGATTPSTPKDTTDADKALLDEISIYTDTDVLYYGGTKGATTTLQMDLPDTLKDVTVSYETKDKKVAKVDSKGKITATGVGSTSIVANFKLNKVSTTLEADITVKAPYIKFVKSTSTMKLGSKFTFTAKAYGVDIKKAVWSTTQNSIVDIDKKTGKAVAKAKGTDYVVVKIGKISKKVKVVVK